MATKKSTKPVLPKFISGQMVSGSFSGLYEHVGHKLVCVCYGPFTGPPQNVAIECEDCGAVVVDFDRDED